MPSCFSDYLPAEDPLIKTHSRTHHTQWSWLAHFQKLNSSCSALPTFGSFRITSSFYVKHSYNHRVHWVKLVLRHADIRILLLARNCQSNSYPHPILLYKGLSQQVLRKEILCRKWPTQKINRPQTRWSRWVWTSQMTLCMLFVEGQRRWLSAFGTQLYMFWWFGRVECKSYSLFTESGGAARNYLRFKMKTSEIQF